MCVTEVRTYIHANGQKQTVESAPHLCSNSDGRRPCPSHRMETSETYLEPQSPSYSLASPASSGFPPTPPTYSTVDARPRKMLTQDDSPPGQGGKKYRQYRPEVTIHIGGGSKRDQEREKKYKRRSANSTHSAHSNHSSNSGHHSSDRPSVSRPSIDIQLGSIPNTRTVEPPRHAHFEESSDDEPEPPRPVRNRQRRPSIVVSQPDVSAYRSPIAPNQRRVSMAHDDNEYHIRERAREAARAENSRREAVDRRMAHDMARAQLSEKTRPGKGYEQGEQKRSGKNEIRGQTARTEQREAEAQARERAARRALKEEEQRRLDAEQAAAIEQTRRQMANERIQAQERDYLESTASNTEVDYNPRTGAPFESAPQLRRESRYITAAPQYTSPAPSNAVLHQPRPVRTVAPPNPMVPLEGRSLRDRQQEVLTQSAREQSCRLGEAVGAEYYPDEELPQPPPLQRRGTNSRRMSISHSTDENGRRRRKPYFK